MISHRLLLPFLLLALAGCVSMIAGQDPVSIKHATDMKVQANLLLDKATDPPDEHALEILEIQIHGLQAHEYARAIPHNELSAKQWSILVDPNKSLLGGFLRLWQERGSGMSEIFVDEVRGNINAAIEEIIRLERAKSDD